MGSNRNIELFPGGRNHPYGMDYLGILEDGDLLEDEEPAGVVPVKSCKHCLQAPCYLDQVDPELDSRRTLYEHLMFRGETMAEIEQPFKEISYELYKVASRFCNGLLGKGVRKELPKCIVGEIQDSFPSLKEKGYTGFKETSND